MDCQARYEKVETMHNFPIKVQAYHFMQPTDETTIPKHWHRSIEFLIPQENGIEMWVEGKVYHVYPETMVLVNSQNIHEFRSINSLKPSKGYSVKIKYDFFSQALPQLDSYQFERIFQKETHPYLFQLIEEMIKLDAMESAYKNMKIYSLAYELCYELSCHYCVEIDERRKLSQSKNKCRLLEIISYLDKNISEVFDALEVDDHFHLSYGYLAKLFKNELGMTMSEYVNSVRIRNASFDLLETDLSINEVAQKHGFASPKAFYKEFKKVYHMTLRQYCKQSFD